MARFSSLILAITGLVALSACTAPSPGGSASESGAAAQSSARAAAPSEAISEPTEAATTSSSPVTVMSCTQELTFEQAPERVVLLGDDSVPFMMEMGLLDKVVGLGETIPQGVYPKDVEEQLAKVPMLESTDTGTGGAQIATETLLEANPDLVIGYDTGADREGLNKAGVPLYSADAWCPDVPKKPAIFHNINDEVRKYAKIFFVEEKGEELIKKMNAAIAEVEKKNAEPRGTGLALYASPGKNTYSAYGNSSMVQPMFEAVGLENVYKDNPDRVIRNTGIEAILEKNPGTVVLLYQDSDPEQLKNEFKALPGAGELDAVKHNKVYALPFVYTDPPTPNTITGVEKLDELLGS